MSFFQRPAPPPKPEPEPQAPAWSGPPDNWVGRVAEVAVVLALTDRRAVSVDGFIAYPMGVEFSLDVRLRSGDLDREFDPFGLHGRHRHRDVTEVDPEFLRFGIEFADGAKATNLDAIPFALSDDKLPSHPVLMPRGGGGDCHRWRQGMWLWPLPPVGSLTMVVEWPAHGVVETRSEIDAGLLHSAAQKAFELWPGPPAGGS